MKKSIKVFARKVLGLFLIITFSSFTPNAQVTQKSDIPEGYSLIDGDILLPTWYVDLILSGKTSQRPEATFDINLWNNGIVPFQFALDITPANQTNMLNAMAVLENVANVDFQQCASNICNFLSDHVLIANSTGNSSQVGRVGGQQVININSWGSQYTIVHELMHCLGFYHEQSRPDRNTYISVNCNNVQGGCNGTIFNNNFTIPGNALPYGAYDFDSLMHYGQCSFSIDCPAGSSCNCTNTVITVLAPNQSWQTLIGQRNHLSVLDQAMVSFLYRQPNWRFLDCSYNGGNGASNGTILRPYTTLSSALANTPSGGTLWVSGPCPPLPTGTYNQQITIRVAPNVTVSFGG